MHLDFVHNFTLQASAYEIQAEKLRFAWSEKIPFFIIWKEP